MKKSSAIIAAVLATATATPANVRIELEKLQAEFVTLRGFQITQSGETFAPAAKNIKNTVGKELAEIETQLIEISMAFDKLLIDPKLSKQGKFINKVARLMAVNINNNPKWEQAKKEAIRKAAKEASEAVAPIKVKKVEEVEEVKKAA